MRLNIIILLVFLLVSIGFFLSKILFVSNYRAGNLSAYGCVTSEKKYNNMIFKQYIDTFLFFNPEFKNPVEINNRNIYPHLYMVSFYFQEEPEEMYQVSVSTVSFSCIRHITKMENRKVLYNVKERSKKDVKRAEKRLKNIWNKIEKLIDKSNLPDSVKYDVN